MSFVTKLFSHKDGTFLARLWETVAGGPLIPAHLSVDRYGEAADFSAPIETVGMYRDFRLGSGQKPPTLAPGERGLPMLDKYQASRASLCVEGVETDAFPPRDFAGTEVFSANRVPMVAAYSVALDSRTRKPTAMRVVNDAYRANRAADGVLSAVAYVGPVELESLFIDVLATVPVYVRLHDLAALPDEANLALTPPKLLFRLREGARTLPLGKMTFLNGLVVRVTRGVADSDKTALVAGDFEALNVTYAR